jgi:hypothetical protein
MQCASSVEHGTFLFRQGLRAVLPLAPRQDGEMRVADALENSGYVFKGVHLNLTIFVS